MTERTRRDLLRALGAAGAAGVAGCGGDGGTGTTTGDGTTTRTSDDGTTTDGVALETLADGFSSPVGVEFPGGVDGRAYVVEQTGEVVAVGPDGETTTFLDVRDRMVSLGGGYSEMGLLGLAFHPDFPEDDRVFVRYSAPPRAGTPEGYSHTFVLASFRATATGADPDSERTLLEIPEPQSNHNGGAVVFGPDGYLYLGVGDGGGGGDDDDGHVADWYDGVGGGNGQDVTANLLGSVLRIDVDGADGDRPYGVPDDNPLVGREGLDEHYAWGFRNPWRMSFDGEDLYAADVGQNQWEEVDHVRAGGNYGWNVREGAHCFRADDCPAETPAGDPLVPPVVEYPHGGQAVSGIAVIGGYVYRGDALPGLRGRYVFADWQANGRLFVATPREEGRWPVEVLPVTGGASRVLAFGRDAADELYVCTSSTVERVVAP